MHILTLALVAVFAAGCAAQRAPLQIREPDYGQSIDPETLEAARAALAQQLAAELNADGAAYTAYLRANLALQSGDVRTAVRELKLVVARDPQAAAPRLRLAGLLMLLGQADEAGKLLVPLDVDPYTLSPELLEVYVLYVSRSQRSETAEAAIRAALERGVLNPLVLVQWIASEEARRAPEDLRAFVQGLKAIDPEFPVLACMDGHLAVRSNAYDEALAPLEVCLEAFPDWLPGMLERGLVAELLGDDAAARLWYQRVLVAQPGQALAAWRLRSLDTTGDEAGRDSARAQLQRLLAEVRFETSLQLAAQALNDRDDLRAEAILDGLPAEWRERPRVLILRGPIFEARGDLDAAAALYARAMTAPVPALERVAALQWVRVMRLKHGDSWREVVDERYRDTPTPALAIAYAMGIAEDDPSAALTFLSQAAATLRPDAELIYRLGVLYEQLGRRDEALATMEQVLTIDPRHPDAMNFIGYSLAEVGRELERAEALIRAALELKPNAGYIKDSLGWVLFQQGKADEAIVWLEEAIVDEGPDPVIWEHLGDAYAVVGRWEDARRAYSEALGLTDDPAAAARIRDKILKVEP